jgi:glutaredoxin 3
MRSASPKRIERRTTACVLTGAGKSQRSGPAAAHAWPDRVDAANPTGGVAILSEAMANITVYSTDPCSFCARAKELLERRGYLYEEINLSKDPAGRAELVEKTGMFSFPQIVIDGEVLGGFRELVQADTSGRLEELATVA